MSEETTKLTPEQVKEAAYREGMIQKCADMGVVNPDIDKLIGFLQHDANKQPCGDFGGMFTVFPEGGSSKVADKEEGKGQEKKADAKEATDTKRDAYVEGFIAKCAELGVEPEELIKARQ